MPGTRLGPLTLPPVTAFPTPFPRKRENSLQEDRGSFVTTPTAELSSQEETLLGSFLDWSLDYCSGYEGDQESEGEKEGDGEWRAGLAGAAGARVRGARESRAPGTAAHREDRLWPGRTCAAGRTARDRGRIDPPAFMTRSF